MPEEIPILKYDNLLVSSRGITETDGSKVILFVPSAEIESIEVKFGRSDHSPFSRCLSAPFLPLSEFTGWFTSFWLRPDTVTSWP
jgi:hypothetical protein